MNSRREEFDMEFERLRTEKEAADAQRSGVLTSLIGTIAVLVISVLCDRTKDQRFVSFVWSILGGGVFFLPIGLFSGWIAHKYFAGKVFRSSTAAAFIALIPVLSILGWGFVVSLAD